MVPVVCGIGVVVLIDMMAAIDVEYFVLWWLMTLWLLWWMMDLFEKSATRKSACPHCP